MEFYNCVVCHELCIEPAWLPACNHTGMQCKQCVYMDVATRGEKNASCSQCRNPYGWEAKPRNQALKTNLQAWGAIQRQFPEEVKRRKAELVEQERQKVAQAAARKAEQEAARRPHRPAGGRPQHASAPAPPQGRGRERADAHVAAALMKPLDAWSMHAALRVLTGDFLPARWVYPKRRQIEFIHVYGLDLDLFMSTRYESKLGRGQAPARKLASTARISQLVVPSAARWLIVALPTARSPRGGILGLQARALRPGLRAHAAGACDDISRKFAADRGWRRDAAHQSGGLKSAAARMAGSKVSALTRQSSMPLGSETMAMSSTPSPVSSSIS
jgi:hypothetical protein